MDIQINYDYREDDIRSLFDIEQLVAYVIERQGCPDTTEVSVSFVTDEEIHALNREYRGIDRPTDVLSFECDGLDDGFGILGADSIDAVSAINASVSDDDIPFELGDIVIAIDIAQAQAPEYGMTLPDEVSLLITHGLLHLCGMDHMEEDEALAMEAREVELLSGFWNRPFKRHGLAD